MPSSTATRGRCRATARSRTASAPTLVRSADQRIAHITRVRANDSATEPADDDRYDEIGSGSKENAMNDAAANYGDAADRVDMRDPGWRADPHPLLRELR